MIGISERPWLLHALRLGLGLTAVVALFVTRWDLAFVSALTLGLSFVPVFIANRFHINLPMPFLVFTDPVSDGVDLHG